MIGSNEYTTTMPRGESKVPGVPTYWFSHMLSVTKTGVRRKGYQSSVGDIDLQLVRSERGCDETLFSNVTGKKHSVVIALNCRNDRKKKKVEHKKRWPVLTRRQDTRWAAKVKRRIMLR